MLDVGIKGTLQEIALKVAEQQMKEQECENLSKERTIFVLGSKEVVSYNHNIRMRMHLHRFFSLFYREKVL